MNEIKRNRDPIKGPPDGVEADVKCVITVFERKKRKGDSPILVKRKVTAQSVEQVRVLCAYTEGTISFSMHSADTMLTLRVDELVEILKAAAEASRDHRGSLPQGFTDAELEARWRELSTQRFEESDMSPSGLVLAGKWWLFDAGVDRLDIWNYFKEHHSKGVVYLQGLEVSF